MVITIANLKGGVGKTASAVYLAQTVSRDKKVLLIDADKQANASKFFLEYQDYKKRNLLEFLKTRKRSNIIKITDTLDLLPGTLQLAQVSEHFAGVMGKEMLFKMALAPALPDYDCVIIDTPPDLGIININAIMISDIIIIPVDSDEMALDGARSIFDNIQAVDKTFGLGLKKVFVLPVKIETRFDKKILKNIPELFQDVEVLESIPYYHNLKKTHAGKKLHKKLLNDYAKTAEALWQKF